MKSKRLCSLLASAVGIVVLLCSASVAQQTVALDIDADGDSRFFDFFSAAFAQLDQGFRPQDGEGNLLAPDQALDGFFGFDPGTFDPATFNPDFSDPQFDGSGSILQFGGGQDIFLTEEAFSGGSYSITYDDTGLSNSGFETASITEFDLDFSGDIGGDVLGNPFTGWTVNSSSGTVDLFNGEIVAVNGESILDVQLAGAVNYDGNVVFTGSEWRLLIDDTENPGAEIRLRWDVGGSMNLAAVPEPSSGMVVAMLVFGGLCRRRR